MPATFKVDPIREIRIGDLRAEFEKTTLGGIINTLGIGSIQPEVLYLQLAMQSIGYVTLCQISAFGYPNDGNQPQGLVH